MKYLTPLIIALVLSWLFYEYKRPIVIKISMDIDDGADYEQVGFSENGAVNA